MEGREVGDVVNYDAALVLRLCRLACGPWPPDPDQQRRGVQEQVTGPQRLTSERRSLGVLNSTPAHPLD